MNRSAEQADVCPVAMIVEDDSGIASALQKILLSQGYTCTIANTLQQARIHADKQVPQVVLIDLGMPDGSGANLVRELRDLGVDKFIVISGTSSQRRTLECLRAGVTTYLTKPVNTKDIRGALQRIDASRLAKASAAIEHVAAPSVGVGGVLGRSVAADELRVTIKAIARIKPVQGLVIGEPGSHKVDVAACVHHETGATGRALHICCANEVDAMAEARFMGRCGGSSDSAGQAIRGYIEQAHEGTLILDDISLLPQSLQLKLVSFLDKGQIVPVNGTHPRRYSCAVIGILRESESTARSSGRLLEDLYHRLGKSKIRVPSLSSRPQDTVEFAERAVRELNAITGMDKMLSSGLKNQLLQHEWPGGFVELRHALLASYMATEPDDEIVHDERLLPMLRRGEPLLPVDHLVGKSFGYVEDRLLKDTLDMVGGSKKKAALILGISLKTLYNRIQQHA